MVFLIVLFTLPPLPLKETNLFAFELLVIPVFKDIDHWCMMVVHVKENTIKYHDSMRGPKEKCVDVSLNR